MASMTTLPVPPATPGSRSAIVLICISTLLCISVWFSASFIIEGISSEWHVPDAQLVWVTFGVQAGFIIGAVASALLRLPNRFSARALFCSCAVGAGLANFLLLVIPGYGPALVLRLVTGIFLAGIYPVAVRETMAWVRPGRRGLASSALLGALTIGSAAPHLIKGFGDTDWRVVILTTTVCCLLGAVLFLRVPGPAPFRDTGLKVNFRQGLAILKNRKVLLVNLAYFSHMWELYAMWASVGMILHSRLAGDVMSNGPVAIASFIVIASGAVGCLAGGLLGDRYGKIAISQIFMLLSGAAATVLALSAAWDPAAVLILCIIWGITIVGDSALLSALLRQYCPEAHVGSALSVQMAGGYAVSAGSIALFPLLAQATAWEFAVLMLAIGPVVGIIVLQFLKLHTPVARAHFNDVNKTAGLR